jgi:hypothetical protein
VDHPTKSAKLATRAVPRSIGAAIALAGIGAGCMFFGPGPSCVRTAAAAPRAIVDVGPGGVPRVSVDLASFADDALRLRLESGLAQTVVTRVDAYDPSDTAHARASAVRSCRVRYDEWTERYEARVETESATSALVTSSLDEIIRACLELREVPVGDPSDWADRAPTSASFALAVELNPLSRETAHRVHRWLERDGRGQGDTFFGPFVGLFVDAQIGEAERALGPHGSDR